MNEVLDEASRIKVDGRYVDMLRDWAEHGADSRYLLTPAEVVEQLRPRDRGNAEGQAHLELGAALWARATNAVRNVTGARPIASTDELHGQASGVVARRPRCGRLRPLLAGPLPGREDEWPYDTDWLSEVRDFGAENYYPPIDV